LPRDEIDQVQVRVEPVEDLFAVFRESHRGLPFWVPHIAVNDKGQGSDVAAVVSRRPGSVGIAMGPLNYLTGPGKIPLSAKPTDAGRPAAELAPPRLARGKWVR
jgi:hypothetical protein